MKKLLLASAVTAAIAAPTAALAQAPSAKPSAPTLDQVLEASGIAIDGYIDAGYTHLSGTGLFTSGVANRVFDTERNSFLLHQAATKQPKEGAGGLVNLTAGKDANIIAPFSTNSTTSSATSNFDVTQAFAQYAIGPLTVMAGKYVTGSGAEVIKSTGNANYSRSILFGYAIPFTHTGIRGTYAPAEWFSLIAGANNGWDNLKDTNGAKTSELGFSLTPIKPLAIIVVNYNGDEQVGGLTAAPPKGKRNLTDVVATFAFTDRLSLTLNYDSASQENTATVTPRAASKAKWSGFAGYVTYQFTDTWRLAVRGENFDDEDGYRTGVVQKWKEGTVTLAYLPAKNFELRGEVRKDSSNVASFRELRGPASKDQTSYGLQALYKF